MLLVAHINPTLLHCWLAYVWSLSSIMVLYIITEHNPMYIPPTFKITFLSPVRSKFWGFRSKWAMPFDLRNWSARAKGKRNYYEHQYYIILSTINWYWKNVCRSSTHLYFPLFNYLIQSGSTYLTVTYPNLFQLPSLLLVSFPGLHLTIQKKLQSGARERG
jgi:hypothetical protein